MQRVMALKTIDTVIVSFTTYVPDAQRKQQAQGGKYNNNNKCHLEALRDLKDPTKSHLEALRDLNG